MVKIKKPKKGSEEKTAKSKVSIKKFPKLKLKTEIIEWLNMNNKVLLKYLNEVRYHIENKDYHKAFSEVDTLMGVIENEWLLLTTLCIYIWWWWNTNYI